MRSQDKGGVRLVGMELVIELTVTAGRGPNFEVQGLGLIMCHVRLGSST